jgi:hypothetical protein
VPGKGFGLSAGAVDGHAPACPFAMVRWRFHGPFRACPGLTQSRSGAGTQERAPPPRGAASSRRTSDVPPRGGARSRVPVCDGPVAFSWSFPGASGSDAVPARCGHAGARPSTARRLTILPDIGRPTAWRGTLPRARFDGPVAFSWSFPGASRSDEVPVRRGHAGARPSTARRLTIPPDIARPTAWRGTLPRARLRWSGGVLLVLFWRVPVG